MSEINPKWTKVTNQEGWTGWFDENGDFMGEAPPDESNPEVKKASLQDHAKYLLDNGYVKNMTLDGLIKALGEQSDQIITGDMDTFADLDKFNFK